MRSDPISRREWLGRSLGAAVGVIGMPIALSALGTTGRKFGRRSVIVSDAFGSAPNGSLLQAHTSPGGYTWTKAAGSDSANLQIQGGYVCGDSSLATQYYAFSAQPAVADYTVRAQLTNPGGSETAYGLLIRFDPATGNGYLADLDPFQGQARIYRLTGGALNGVVQFGSYIVPSLLEFECSGTTLTLRSGDGSTIVSGSDATYSGPGFGGLGVLVTRNPGNVAATSFEVEAASFVSAGTNIAKSDFSSGAFAPQFYNPWSDRIDVVDDPTGGGHGKVLRIHYINDPSGGYVDDNRAVGINPLGSFTRGLGETVWFQGDFYIPPTAVMDANLPTVVQRKLVYWEWSNDSWGFQHPFAMVVLCQGPQFAISDVPQQSFTDPNTGHIDYIPIETARLTSGVWHRLKIQMQINSSFAATDGILRIWYDGILLFDHTDMRWTDPSWTEDPTTYQWVQWNIGQQVNNQTIQVDEFRYWDNLSFATAEGAL